MQFHEVVCTHIPSGDILFVIELEDPFEAESGTADCDSRRLIESGPQLEVAHDVVIYLPCDESAAYIPVTGE